MINFHGNRGWDFRSNPLNISNRGIGNYVDFKNSDQMKQVNALKQHSGFFDYYSPFTADIGGMGIVSLFHHVQYNGTKQHGWVPINNEKK